MYREKERRGEERRGRGGRREERGWEGAAEEQSGTGIERDRQGTYSFSLSLSLSRHHPQRDIPPPYYSNIPYHIHSSPHTLYIQLAHTWLSRKDYTPLDGWTREVSRRNRAGVARSPLPPSPPGVAVYDLPRSDISHDRLDPRAMLLLLLLPASTEENLA